MIKTPKGLPLLFFYSMLIFSSACQENQTGENKDTSSIPGATGPAGEIYVFVDTTVWQSSVGEATKEIFNKDLPGLINPEPAFTLNTINPVKANKLTRRFHDIIYLVSLQHNTPMTRAMVAQFDEKTIKRVQQDTTLLFFRNKNQFARGQQTIYIIARNDRVLTDFLQENERRLFNLIESFERDYVAENLYSGRPNQAAEKALRKAFPNTKLKVPKGFGIARQKSNFVWFRAKATQNDKNIFVASIPYSDTSQFNPGSIREMIDSITTNNIWGSGEENDSSSALIQERREPLFVETIRWKGNYAKEIRGVWKLRNNAMGGVFLSYLILHEPTQKLYYIHSFVFAPNQAKREKIRQLEAILHTFSIEQKSNS